MPTLPWPDSAEVQSLATELPTFPWFSRCGQALPRIDGVRLAAADSARHAQAQLTGPLWAWVKLDAQNAMSAHLAQTAPERHRLWNERVQQDQGRIIGPLMTRVIDPALQAAGLGPAAQRQVAHDLSLSLVGCRMRDLPGAPAFFEQLLPVYRAGHLPCGWRGGRPPQGELLAW